MSPSSQDGYATAAAVVISLAIGVVAAAVTSRALVELRLARAAYARSQAEYILEGAHNEALIAISTTTRPPPYRWSVDDLGQTIHVLAEPERAKLSPGAASLLGAELLNRLGAGDSEAVRERLAGLTQQRHLVWIADQADAQVWRDCAPSFVSTFGAGAAIDVPAYDQPAAAPLPASWRAGQVWRISAQHPAGWRDERIVRFTGDGVRPAAILGRRLTRSSKGQPKCEEIFRTASGA